MRADSLHSLTGLLDRFQKPLQRDGLEEVIHHVELVAFQGVLGVGGGQDYQRLLLEDLEQRGTGNLRHLHVQEKQVHGLVAQDFQGGEGAGAGVDQLQVGHLANVILQQVAGQRLVVDDEAGKGGQDKRRFSCTA